MFDRLNDGFEMPTGFNDLAFRLLPQQPRLKIAIPALARLLTQHSDLTCRVTDRGATFDFTIERCPECWGRQSKRPVCNMTVGLLLEAMSHFGRGQEFRVTETECCAAGAAACVFRLDKEPIV
jgi:predicted hydrocarbon binding protein